MYCRLGGLTICEMYRPLLASAVLGDHLPPLPERLGVALALELPQASNGIKQGKGEEEDEKGFRSPRMRGVGDEEQE